MPYSEKQLAKNKHIMTLGEPIAVELVTYEEQRAAGTISHLRMTEEQRGKRARNFLLASIGFGCLAIVCPPHFPWPITGIIVGIVGYFARKKQSERVLGGQTHCPACGAFQIIDAGNYEFPKTHFCTECNKRSIVNLVAGSTGSAEGVERT